MPSFTRFCSLLLAAASLQQFVLADQARQGFSPAITPAPKLKIRQDETCDPGNTICPDGLGCCPNGAPCTWTSNAESSSIPICDVKCNALSVTCDGAFSDVCCPAGSSCAAASQGMCTADGGFGGLSSSDLALFSSAVPTTTAVLTVGDDASSSEITLELPLATGSGSSAGAASSAAASTSQSTRLVGGASTTRTGSSASSTGAAVQSTGAAVMGRNLDGALQYVFGGLAGLLAVF